MNVLPLFKSHYSVGRSILTFDKAGRSEFGPVSIFTIVKENNLKEVAIVDDSISGFLEFQKNSSGIDCKFIYGVRLVVVTDMENKEPDSVKESSKIIIFIKNNEGYYKLLKILSKANTDGNYKGIGRIDYKTLSKMWDNKSLSLAIPFYDSFLFNNILMNYRCVPDLSFTKPVFFIENNSLPFDDYLAEKVKEFCLNGGYRIIDAQSIFYEKKEDFTAYLTFRCIINRSSVQKPELNHMCSDEFCFESWFIKNYARQSAAKQ